MGGPVGPPFQPMESSVMKRLVQIGLIVMAFGVAGCDDGRYPMSGEPCGPDDPVKTLDANECAPLPAM